MGSLGDVTVRRDGHVCVCYEDKGDRGMKTHAVHNREGRVHS